MTSSRFTVTIDAGTTNTRCTLWRDADPVARATAEVGVRDTSITGSAEKLGNGVRTAILDALSEAHATVADVRLFLASGMITSNMGLLEVPHVRAPAGVAELADAMVEASLPAVVPAPIWFVPGIKNDVAEVTMDTWEAMDVMRGEEVETFGILKHLGMRGPILLILPGSHSKFVHVDADDRITGCVTTLAGELLSVITRQTILASSLKQSFADVVDEDMAIRGAVAAARVGLTRACFGVRILEQFAGAPQPVVASFLAGAVVGTDLLAVKASSAFNSVPEVPILVGGTNALARIFALLARRDPELSGNLTLVDEAIMRNASAVGALAVASRRGLLAGAA